MSTYQICTRSRKHRTDKEINEPLKKSKVSEKKRKVADQFNSPVMKRKIMVRVLESSSEDEDTAMASVSPVLTTPPSRASQSQSLMQGSTHRSPPFRRTPSIMARLEVSAPLSPIHDMNENLDDSLEATEVGGMDGEESLADDIIEEDE